MIAGLRGEESIAELGRKKDLILSYSFVPSGTALSLARLYDCFHQNAAATLKAAPGLPTNTTISRRERNVIVLGTPTTSWELLKSYDCEGMHGAALRSD